MYPKLIRRNATRQQAAIFSQIKSAKFIPAKADSEATTIADIPWLYECYKFSKGATLTQMSDCEYRLRAENQTAVGYYLLSTEKPEVTTTKEIDLETISSKTEVANSTEIESELATAIAVEPKQTQDTVLVAAETQATPKPKQPKTPSRLIDRNATHQLESIFSQVKLAKVFKPNRGFVPFEFESLIWLQEEYSQSSPLAGLFQERENIYYLTMDNQDQYLFFTEETEQVKAAFAPSKRIEVEPAAPEQSDAIAPATQTPEIIAEDAIASSQSQSNLTNLENELALAQAELSEHCNKIAEIGAKIKRLQSEVNSARNGEKARATIIKLERVEGRHDECRIETATDWKAADLILRKWTLTAPDKACDKCNIWIDFANGESFKMRFDLQQRHSFQVSLAAELKRELEFMSGICPTHMTQKDYDSYLEFCKIDTARYKRLMDSWEIPA